MDDGTLLSGRTIIRQYGDDLVADMHLGGWVDPPAVLHEAAHVITPGDNDHGNALLDAFEQLVSDRYGEDGT